MKKHLLVVLALVLTFTLTGCGSEEEKNPTSIPSELQGLYQGSKYSSNAEKYVSGNLAYYFIYKIEDNTVKRKICLIGTASGIKKTINNCDFDDDETGLFATRTYDIKDITLEYDDENVRFNMYDGEELYAKCYTRFGNASCTTNEGDHLSWSKKN